MSVTTSPAAPDPCAEARALLQQGRLPEALARAQDAVDATPEGVEGLYLLAVCQRYLRDHAAALATLRRLRRADPAYARGYQELGHNQRALGDGTAALAAYRQAVQLNPALLASWQALAALAEAEGETELAEEARERGEALARLPRELQSVASMLHEGRIGRAERLCRAFLRRHPRHVEGMRLLARIGLRHYVLDDAEFLLESALALEPDHLGVRFDYLNVLHKRQKFEPALAEARILRQRRPGHPGYEVAYANQCMAVGDVARALSVYDAVADQTPDNPHVHLLRGHALKTVGRSDEAVAAYHAACVAAPDFGDAWWSLANLKTYRFPAEEIDAMRAAEGHGATGLADRIHLCFALGKALEDAGDFEQSMACYQRGNRLRRDQLGYRRERIDREIDLQMRVCTRPLFERLAGVGDPAADPIFIVGLPRAGSTLLEQILASHSMVDGTMELPNVLATAHRLNGRRLVSQDPRYPKILAELEAERFAELGRAYLDGTRVYRADAPRFTDKMPNNFRHVGLIHLMLPNARIIDARRDPMACCFSGFKQYFAEGQEFTYGLEEIGHYYRRYVELMDHWDRVLPGRVLRVDYESVVADLEGEVRRILDFCGLPFEAACLAYHTTDRAVRTPSAEQVRRPIYTDALEQWRHYEPWLGPLKDALGPVLDRAAALPAEDPGPRRTAGIRRLDEER